jgi:hypothetical protein
MAVLPSSDAAATERSGVFTPVQGSMLSMRHAAKETFAAQPTTGEGSPVAPEGPPVDDVAAPTEPASPQPPATDAAPPAESAAPASPEGDSAVPTPPPSEPATPESADAPTEAAVPEPEPAPTEPGGIDRDLLGAEPDTTPAPPRRPVVQSDPDDDDEDAALRRAYANRYRPEGNPTKVNVVARGLFTNMGGRGSVGGRMGGVRADVGPAWNRVAIAGTFTAWGGRVLLPSETGAEMNAMLGIGPTLGLGRIALVGRGFLDLRVGYDFFYGVVNERADRAAVLASQADPQVVFVQTENILPHGPRVTLDLGLLSEGRGESPYFHGFGASMGWQGLVHDLRGRLPVTNMLTMGLVYWFG